MFRRKRARNSSQGDAENRENGHHGENPPPDPGPLTDPLDLRLNEPDDTPIHLTMDATIRMRDELAEAERRLGADHEDVLLLRHNYAFTLSVWSAAAPPGDTYMQDQAIPLLLENLTHQSAALGPHARDTLVTLQLIGSAHLSAGRPAEAVPYLEQALEGSESGPDRDAERTLTWREKLSDAYAAAGGTDRAIALLEETVAGSRHLLPPGSEQLEARKQKLFKAYHAAGGRLPEATALCREIVSDKERFYGPDHLDTYIWWDNLAHLHHDARDLDAAVACYERVIGGFERIHGADSEEIAYRYHNLAIAHLEAGRPERALPYLKASLAAREHALGPDHVGTLDALIALISGYDQARRIDEAIAATERLITDLLRIGGPEHPKLPEVRTYLDRLRQALAEDRPAG